jgi:3',5'-cyclic-AMP phosphodiesterase
MMINRRSFLKNTLMVSAGSFFGSRSLFCVKNEVAHWALFSDTHISANPADVQGAFHIHENFKKAIGQVVESHVDGMIITGDLARKQGLPEDYQALAQMLAPLPRRMPLGIAPGNHDHHDNLAAVFPTANGQQLFIPGKRVTILETPACDFLLLDSLLSTDLVPGFLGKKQREWLSQYVNQPSTKPILVFLHHDLSNEDNSLLDAEQLIRILEPARRVKAIVYGHTHRFECQKLKDLHLINLPSLAYNFASEQPVGWVEAFLDSEKGRFKLHALAGNTQGNNQEIELRWRQ